MSDVPEHERAAGDAAAEDFVDLIVHSVPPHVWVTLGAIVIMVFFGWSFARHMPKRAAITDTGGVNSETLQGRVALVQSTRVLVDITGGSQAGHQIAILPNGGGGSVGMIGDSTVHQGDEVFVEHYSGGPAGDQYLISEYVRLPDLLLIAAVFALVTVLVGLWVGVRALISMGISILAIFSFIIPGIAAGHDPLLVCLMGSLLLMIASLYLTYEWRWKTHVTVISVGASLIVSALLAILATNLSHLTGYSTDESTMLVQAAQVPMNLRGVLMGGVLMGAAGVLGDAVVSQTSAAFELKSANPALRWQRLFRHCMAIGRDHIASMVNTLLLAYVSAALPLLLLLTAQHTSFVQTLNSELIAEEVVRTLVGSVGLILAVPLSSLLASLVADKRAAPEPVESPPLA